MSFEIEATYENGVLKLDKALPLVEHQRVKVVVEEPKPTAETGNAKDLLKALKEIRADQARRGFAGTLTHFDRDDDAYEQRMREILSNTVSGKRGDAGIP